MKTYYVTFGVGTIFRNYYAEFQAYNDDIIRAFLNKRYPTVWAHVYATPKELTKAGMIRLQESPEVLAYQTAEDVR